MNRYIPLAIIAAVAVAIGVGVSMANQDEPATQNTATSPPPSQNNSQPAPAPAGNAAVTDEVEIEDMAYRPANITIKKGTTVTWTNKDDVAHTVTADSGNGPASGSLNRDDSYSFTFNETGEFSYYCVPHPQMTGKVTVTD